MARSRIALNDFLSRHCRIDPSATAAECDYYVFKADEGRPYMTESHVHEILRSIGQPPEASPAPAFGITVHKALGPDSAIELIRLPVKLIASLNERQAFLILRHLDGIQKDVEEGRTCKARLEDLFQDTATVTIDVNREGDRVYNITGKLAENDRRRYMERYAEQVASRTLFDIAKALNAKLEPYVPPESREKFFVEGNDFSDRKVRYGEEVNTELTLSDEGAWVYTGIASKSPHLRETISKLFQQAMTDPFGLSLKHYMGKHNVLKAGKRPLVKIPPVSGFIVWLKGLFGKRAG